MIWARGCVHISPPHTRSANVQICHVLNLRIILGNNVVSYRKEQLIQETRELAFSFRFVAVFSKNVCKMYATKKGLRNFSFLNP